jgi:serine/threonine protein kinase
MGTVRIAKNKNGKYMVFKAVRKDYVVKHNDHRHIQNERDILRALNCSFCVRLFGTFQDRVNVYYVLEYCPGGELFQRLGRKKQFPPEEAKFYISEVFVALEHVQELGYVYRDLKPENVILDEEGHCKLVDFGFSTPCADNTTKLHTLCGTPAYLSPEQLDGKFTNGYTRVVDWWSFGVLIYELLTGKTPFSRNNKESHYEIFLRILNKRISFPWGMDSVSKDIISKLCHAQLDKRLCSAPEIKEHQYFTMPWEDVKNRRLVPPFVPRIKEEGDIHYFKSYAAPLVPKDSGGDDQGYGYFDF